MNLIMNQDCKANKDDKMDCNDIAMADWISKTKKDKSAFGKK
jgi:hypothetical protein